MLRTVLLGCCFALVPACAPAAAQSEPPLEFPPSAAEGDEALAIRRLPPVQPIPDPNVNAPPEGAAAEELPAPDEADADGDAEGELTEEEVFGEPMFGWVFLQHWERRVELGVSNQTGNTETTSIRVGAKAKRKTDRSKLSIELDYSRSSVGSVETANQGNLDSRHDWLSAGTPWALFVASSLEFDRFRAFDWRVANNAGVAYDFLDHEDVSLTGRFGAGYSQEIGGPDNSYVPEAVFGLEFERQLTKQQKLTADVEYFADWSEFGDFRIRSELGWEILLDFVSHLSLKLSMIDRYDSTPNGLRPNDLSSALLLLWKF